MAFDAFLEIDGIPGESTDSAHKGQIEVLGFSHGEDQPISGSISSGGGISGERVNHAPFRFRHTVDKASPKLHLACCNGTHIAKVALDVCRATGDKQSYYKVEMENCLVRRATMLGNLAAAPTGDAPAGVDVVTDLPVEEIEFVYGKVTWTYTETDHKTGKAAGNIEAHWDVEDNTGG